MTANLSAVPRLDRLPISPNNNNNLDTPWSATATAMSPFSSMDALSLSLWNIETQMRRPSFLMNRRTSILSTLFATNSIAPTTTALEQYDQPTPSSDFLTVESVEEPNSIFLGIPKERHESSGAGPLDVNIIHSVPDQAMDWRAWHGSWIRRRVKPEDDYSLLSPTSPVPRTSCSSTRSTFSSKTNTTTSSSASPCISPNATLSPGSKLVKRLSQRLRRPRILSPTSPTSTLSSTTSPLSQFASPTSPFYSPFAVPNTPTTPTKDANPELWENEGQKWGDRFQSLLSNFQPSSPHPSSSPASSPLSTSLTSPLSSSGKSPKKRWADMLPKNRWNKWSSRSSSARSSSESERA
ncbi:hypothetical protein BGX23_002183 [Mortierella sp. AD031]|nr:hypothetical protein BGX23_002183 [Mortierella sp. AD031]